MPHPNPLRVSVITALLLTGAGVRPPRADEARFPVTRAADLSSDPRLARHVDLTSEGRPLREVLARLSEASGVSLALDRASNGERLVAFARSQSIADVMRSIATLYRLEWRRSAEEPPHYTLSKPKEWSEEESHLRRESFQRSLAGMIGQMHEAGRPGNVAGLRKIKLPSGEEVPLGEGNQALFARTVPLIEPLLSRLVQEGAVDLPIAPLPEETRRSVVEVLQPWLESMTRVANAFDRAGVAADLAEHRRTHSPYDYQPDRAEGCSIVLELQYHSGLGAWVGLRMPNGGSSRWFSGQGDVAGDAGMQLYADRSPHPRREDRSEGEPFGRPIRLAEVGQDQDRWVEELRAVSKQSGLSVFSDWYAPRSGPAAGGRMDSPLPPELPLQAMLDRLCGARTVRPGAPDPAPGTHSFWWRQGNTVLLRSHDWLWDGPSAISEELSGQLTKSVRNRHSLSAMDLTALANLTPLQVCAIQDAPGGLRAWRDTVRIPATFSLAARERLLTGRLTWSDLTLRDRGALVAGLREYERPFRETYTASVHSRLGTLPGRPLKTANLLLQSHFGGEDTSTEVSLPLPELLQAPVTVARAGKTE